VNATPLGVDGPQLDRGSDRNAVRLTSTASRWSSDESARDAQSAERARYAECARRSSESQEVAKQAAYPIVKLPAVSPLPLPEDANTAFRITYVLRLADGPATHFIDRVTLWRGRISVDISFLSISRPFDEATKQRVLARVRTHLNDA
jgi:hypothetical protein